MVLGLNEAHSIYACAWCKISNNERLVYTTTSLLYKVVIILSIVYRWKTSTPFNTNCRSISEMQRIVSSKTKPNYGCIKMPLLELDLEHVIPDELHMLLRVTDVLIQNLINAATSNDLNISKVSQSKVRLISVDIVS